MNNKKGFTFEQMAALALVIIGLVVGVILASTQFKGMSERLNEIGKQTASGAEASVQTAGNTFCSVAGGTCSQDCETYILEDDKNGGCPDNLNCCEKIKNEQ